MLRSVHGGDGIERELLLSSSSFFFFNFVNSQVLFYGKTVQQTKTNGPCHPSPASSA